MKIAPSRLKCGLCALFLLVNRPVDVSGQEATITYEFMELINFSLTLSVQAFMISDSILLNLISTPVDEFIGIAQEFIPDWAKDQFENFTSVPLPSSLEGKKEELGLERLQAFTKPLDFGGLNRADLNLVAKKEGRVSACSVARFRQILPISFRTLT